MGMFIGIGFAINGLSIGGGGDGGGPAPSAPINDTPPSIDIGDGSVGTVAVATPGAWTGQDTITGQWQVNSGGWIDISGETSTSFTLTLETAGLVIRYVETATNGVGSVSEPSNEEMTSSYTRTAFLYSAGDDGTAALNNISLPYATLQAALDALSAAYAGQTTTVRYLDDVVNDATVPDALVTSAGLTLKGHTGLALGGNLTFGNVTVELTLDDVSLPGITWTPNTVDGANAGAIIGLNGGAFVSILAQGDAGPNGSPSILEFVPGGQGVNGTSGRNITVNGSNFTTGTAELSGGNGGNGGNSSLDYGGNAGNGGNGGNLTLQGGASVSLSSVGGTAGSVGNGALGDGATGSDGSSGSIL